MKENKEQLYPVVSITRSYSQKLNRGKFQTSDFFASRNFSWFYNPTPAEIEEKSNELFAACYNEIEQAIKKETQKLLPEEEKVIEYESAQPRTKYGKDNCGCRYGRTCDSHKLEFQLDAEQYDKENPRTKDEVPVELQ